ncbi:MAG TPA: aminopeptidase [Woeseiaceae bacterium]
MFKRLPPTGTGSEGLNLTMYSFSQINSNARRLFLVSSTIATLLLLQGCYYVQAINGHRDVMKNRQPIDEVLANPEAGSELKEKLRLVQEARRFATEQLRLPDNESYSSYADLGRDYVVWNVFAAPEFSVDAKQWCFPVAGCVAYRGYFAQDPAEEKAESLRKDGYDVAVGGVAAYSTLGRFADPVLNTMMRWSDTQLVAVIFHELAHQVLYVKGDSRFNESFATAVADIGIRRWLVMRNEDEILQNYRNSRERQRALVRIVEQARSDLAVLYDAEIEPHVMRSDKERIFARLARDVDALNEQSAAPGRIALAEPLNNARLVSLGLYEGWSEAFRNIYDECAEDLECFYSRSRELADLSHEERRAQMTMLNEQ